MGMSDLHETPRSLHELVVLRRGTTYKSALLGDTGPWLLGLASIGRNGGFRDDNLKRYSGDTDGKLLVEPGAMFASLKDVTQSADLLGAVARLPTDAGRGRLTQDTVRLDVATGAVPEYIYWILRTPQYREYCRQHATGTTTLGLSRDDFLRFVIPELDASRRAVIDLLELIEAKIEVNRKTVRAAKSLSRGLYVFHRDSLAPGTVRSLDSIARFTNGLAMQKFPAGADGGIPVVKIRELNKGVTEASGRASSDIRSQFIVSAGDLLFSWSGTLVLKVWSGEMGALNQNLFKVESDEFPQWFVLHAVMDHLDDFRSIARDKATTMGHIKRSHLTAAVTRCPDEKTLAELDATMRPLHEIATSLEIEIRRLVDARDALLPNLMSGELRVRDAEERVGGVL